MNKREALSISKKKAFELGELISRYYVVYVPTFLKAPTFDEVEALYSNTMLMHKKRVIES